MKNLKRNKNESKLPFYILILLFLTMFICSTNMVIYAEKDEEEAAASPQEIPPPEPEKEFPQAPPSAQLPSIPPPSAMQPPAVSPPATDAPPSSTIPPPSAIPPSSTESPTTSPTGEKTANLIFQQAKIELVLQALTSQTGVNITPRGKVLGQRVDTLFRNQTAKEIIESLAYKYKWVSRKIDDTHYELMDEETYQKEVLPGMTIQKIFKLKNITAAAAESALKGVLTKNIGTLAKDDRTNKIIVTDLPQVIEMIKRLLDQIDVKLMTRVFYIKNANIDQIVDKLTNYKSDPGIIDFDPKTHQIIVIDTFENIKRMEMIIDVLDVGPEMKIYDINNIGFEGNLIDELRGLIEKVITPDAFWEINYRAGTLLVEDVPEVHEKIEKILLAFDRPSKQVYIQAEMVEAAFNSSFNYGIQYDFSRDLKAGIQDEVADSGAFKAKTDYGYTNLFHEFPYYSLSGTGFSIKYLDKFVRGQLTAIMSDDNTRIITQPRLLVKNQETATIHVGGKKPYVTYYYNSGDSSAWGRSSTSQAEKDYGTKLELKPSISNNGLVELKVKIEQSVAKEVTGKTVGGDVTLIETSNEEASTVLIIPNGETRVIGGLIKNQESDSTSGIPYLYKIPIIGPFLFGNLKQKSEKMNLYFFVTPTIVEETGLKRKKFSVRTIEEEFPEIEEEETTKTLKKQKTKAEDEESDELDELKDEENLLESSKDVPKDLEKISIMEDLTIPDTTYKIPISGPSGSFSEPSSPTSSRPVTQQQQTIPRVTQQSQPPSPQSSQQRPPGRTDVVVPTSETKY